MTASTLNCPNCAAPTAPEATRCDHCHSTLARIACPQCFGYLFAGMRYCPGCGAKAVVRQGTESQLSCPHCCEALNGVYVGSMHFSECKRCEGLWLDVESFRTICEERESHSFILGEAGLVVPPEGFPIEQVRYIPCPSCSQLMQRVNFAKCSGVVVDVCREHGTWVDKMELQRIVQFIRNGGMSKARQKQLEDLEEKRRRLAETNTRTRHLDSQRSTVAYELVGDPCFWSAIGEAAGGVWNLFTD